MARTKKEDTTKKEPIEVLEKEEKVEEKIECQKKTKSKRMYISYTSRVIICAVVFTLLFVVGTVLLNSSFSVKEAEVTNYSEQGNLDYKVYLKPNDFYETEYLGKGMYYIASLIENIDITFNYQFIIDNEINMDLGYRVYANLRITDSSESNIFFEKKYELKPRKEVKLKEEKQYFLTEKIEIDYDYYNKIANDFKSVYGLDATSNLIVYMEFDKNITDLENKGLLNNSSEMSVKVPLSQKSLDISMNDTGINKTDKIIGKKTMTFDNISLAIIALVLYLVGVIVLIKLLKLLSLLSVRKTVYDKYVERILKEYDRLIVETTSHESFEGKNIIKIQKIEELLDARDSLKLPIIYRSIVKHQKCYFYIKQENNIYLMVVKATDLEVDKNEKKS